MKRFLKSGLVVVGALIALHLAFSTSSVSNTALAQGTAIATAAPTTAGTQAASIPGSCTKLTSSTGAAITAATQPAASVATNVTNSSSPTSGTISADGAFALVPLMQVWANEYGKTNNVQFDIQAGGAGKGITDVLTGAVDIGLVSREIRPEEKAKGATAFPVAIDSVVFDINVANPVAKEIAAKGLTCATLQKIFTSGQKLTWGQVVGTDDTSPINVYTRADSSGAADQVAIYLGGKGQDDLQGTGVQGDNGVSDAVSKDALGIGYNSITFAYDPSTGAPFDGLAIVPLDLNGNGKIDQEESFYDTHDAITAAVAAHKYPNPPTRNLYLVTKGKPAGTVHDFIQWALTDGQAFVEQSGFVKVSPESIQAALDSLK